MQIANSFQGTLVSQKKNYQLVRELTGEESTYEESTG